MIADWPTYAGLLALAIFAIAVVLVNAWREFRSGKISHQRTYGGEPVARRETPMFFWSFITMQLVLAMAFGWFALHVTGYIFGWWGWSIEL